MELIQLQTAKDFSAYSEAITNNKNKNAEKGDTKMCVGEGVYLNIPSWSKCSLLKK